MQFKTGSGWKACYDEEQDKYYGEYGGIMSYNLYELTKEMFDLLSEDMTEGDASVIMYEGRHLYMSVDDRCGPPYTVIFDDDYEKLCPWAQVMKSGKVWPDELTDAAVEIFESEANNREQRRAKKAAREKKSDIAYCGVDCSVCPDFRDNKCPGCRQTEWTEDDICRPVECCREKGISYCGECDSFPCDMMKEFYEESESHKEAYSRMLSMNKKYVRSY